VAEFETVRPLGGLVGKVFSTGQDVGIGLMAALAEGLDQGEGWTTIERTKMIWNASQLAVVVEVHSQEFEGEHQQFAEMNIDLVDGVNEVDNQLLNVLNQLNSQSAGWVLWINEADRKIVCSVRTPLFQSHWWWVIALWRVIPTALTMADANAKLLADLSGGSVSVREHPNLGLRLVRDSWIDGVLRGPGEPVSSLGLMITSLDLANMREVLESREATKKVVFSWPLTALLQDGQGATYAQLREHWHSEFGLGWQFTSVDSVPPINDMSVDGPSGDELLLAMQMNQNLMTSQTCVPIFGGWVVSSPFNIVRNWFLPSPTIEEIQVLSQRSFGAVAGLMLVWFEESFLREGNLELSSDIKQHNEEFESAAHSLNLQNGLLNFPTLLDLTSVDEVDLDDGLEKWLRPRHSIVCSFGIFNPAGPTVSSLELSLAGKEWILYWVMRHPHGPEIIEIGTSPLSDASVRIPELIEECLSETELGVLGPGCHWMEVRLPQFEEAVVRGLRRFATAASDTDWRSECRRVVGGQCDPWATLELDDEALPDIEIDDEIELWVGLVTDPNVVFGHQAFMRSAWEGSKKFALGDFDGAQAAANAINYGVREKLLDDFDFRNREGLLIQHPTHQ